MPGLARKSDLAAVRPDDVFYYCQSDSRSLDLPSPDVGPAHKPLENLALLSNGNTQAAITHSDFHAAVLLKDLDPHRTALGGVFDGVVEQIRDSSGKRFAVRANQKLLFGSAPFDMVARRRNPFLELRDQCFEELPNVKRLKMVKSLTRFEPAEVQQTFHKIPQPLALASEYRIRLSSQLVGPKTVRRKHFRNLAERGQRTAKLVRNRGNEIRLQPRNALLARDGSQDEPCANTPHCGENHG